MFFVLSVSISFSQIKKMKLPRNLTTNLEDEVAPYISMNGKHMLYAVRNKAEWFVQYSAKHGKEWTRGEDVDPLNKLTALNLLGGYCINTEGNEIIFTSKKHGGVGGYDLWVTNKNSHGHWSEPKNLAKPINSATNEALPTYSYDGKTIYFIRCDVLEPGSSECGKIYFSTKKGNLWSEPQPLNASWNECVSTPRISAAGKTMWFAKGKPLTPYVSKFENGTWTTPIKVEGFETAVDLQYISFTSDTRFMYFGLKGESSLDLYIGEIPEELRGEQLSMARFRVREMLSNEPLASQVEIRNKNTGALVDLKFTDVDGEQEFVLAEGDYVAYIKDKAKQTHLIQKVDISVVASGKLTKDYFDIVLVPLTHGAESKWTLEQESEVIKKQDIAALKWMMKANSSKKFLISAGEKEDLEIPGIEVKNHFSEVTNLECEEGVFKSDTLIIKVK